MYASGSMLCAQVQDGSASVNEKDLKVQHHLMKSELVEKASTIISDPQVLINVVSRRVAQLTDPKSAFRSPLVSTMPHTAVSDIALMEIIEGKLHYFVEEPDLSEYDAQLEKDALTFADGFSSDKEAVDAADWEDLEDADFSLDDE